MAVSEKVLTPGKVTFSSLCRENTGRHFLDSGGAYGRWHERSEIPPQAPVITVHFSEFNGQKEFEVTLHTGPWLDKVMTIDRAEQKRFERFARRKENADEAWPAVVEKYAEATQRHVRCWENSYNGDSDLDQVIQYQVLCPHEGCDWFYCDEAITFLQTHNGCDVRGGYSKPVACRPTVDDSCVPMDTVCGYRGERIDLDPAQKPLPGFPEAETDPDPDGRWGVGYSSYPVGELLKSIAEFYPETYRAEDASFEATTNDGWRIRIYPYYPGEW